VQRLALELKGRFVFVGDPDAWRRQLQRVDLEAADALVERMERDHRLLEA
jgi:hypothetical protein